MDRESAMPVPIGPCSPTNFCTGHPACFIALPIAVTAFSSDSSKMILTMVTLYGLRVFAHSLISELPIIGHSAAATVVANQSN